MKDNLFQKHYWSLFKRKTENSHIKDLWNALPRANAKLRPSKAPNMPALSSEDKSTTESESESMLQLSPPQGLDNFVDDSRNVIKDTTELFYPRSFFSIEEPTNFLNELPETPHFLSAKTSYFEMEEEKTHEFEKTFANMEFPLPEDYETQIVVNDDNDNWMMLIERCEPEKKEVPDFLDFENMSFENQDPEYEDPFDRLLAKQLREQANYY